MIQRLLKKAHIWGPLFSFKEQLALGVLLVGGMTIRGIALYNSQLWRDEVYNFFSSVNHSAIDLLFQNQWDTLHASFYFVFLHFWSKISINPDYLRIPSMAASLIILYLSPVLAKKLFPKLTFAPFIFLFLVSVSQTLISLNVVVRPYPFVIAMMFASFILFLDIINNSKTSLTKIILFIVINTGIGFTDYCGVWLILSYYIYAAIYLFFWKPEKKIITNTLISLFLTAMFAVTWVLLFVVNAQNSFRIAKNTYQEFYIDNPILGNLWQLSFFSSSLPTDIFVNNNINYELILAGVIVVLACIGIGLAYMHEKKHAMLLTIITFFPFISSFLFSIWFSPIFIGRNLNIVHIGILLGLTILISACMNFQKLLVVPFLLFFLYNYYAAPKIVHFTEPPYDWKAITREFSGKGDIVIMTDDPTYMYEPIRYYNLITNPGQRISIYGNNIRAPRDSTVYFIKLFPGLEDAKGYLVSYRLFATNNNCLQKVIPLKFIYFARCARND